MARLTECNRTDGILLGIYIPLFLAFLPVTLNIAALGTPCRGRTLAVTLFKWVVVIHVQLMQRHERRCFPFLINIPFDAAVGQSSHCSVTSFRGAVLLLCNWCLPARILPRTQSLSHLWHRPHDTGNGFGSS